MRRRTLARWNQQRPQPRKAVRRDETSGDELAERVLELGVQQPRSGEEFVEERRAMIRKIVGDGLRTRRQRRLRAGREAAERAPVGEMTTLQQHDRRRTHGTCRRWSASIAPFCVVLPPRRRAHSTRPLRQRSSSHEIS